MLFEVILYFVTGILLFLGTK